VTGPLGEPLAAAQVSIEGTSQGVLTGANGRYRIEGVSAGTYVVVAQRLGYQVGRQPVTVGSAGAAEVDFSLAEEALALDEVVVTGTPGGSRRRALGNAVASLDIETERQLSAAPGIEGLLGNNVPGVQLTAPAGGAGGGAKFRIRGSSSLALSGDPLIYINGVRMDPPEAFSERYSSISTLQDINPADIERVEVIKGPAAATLYGTEAANGVIQIFTRKGVQGAPSFTASAELGTNFLQDPAGTFGEAWYRDPETGEVKSVNSYLADEDPDFMPNAFGRPVFRYGPIQQYSVSVRGGSELIRYAASASRVDEKGYTRLDENGRITGRLSLSVVPSPAWNFTLEALEGRSEVQPGWSTQGYFLNFNPLAGRRTPMDAMLNATSEVLDGVRSVWSASATHEPFPWFQQRAVVGVDRNDLSRTVLTPRTDNPLYNATYTDSREGRKLVETQERETLTVDYAATARITVSNEVGAALSGGIQWYSRTEHSGRLDGRSFATSSLTTIDAAAQTTSSESFVENMTLGSYLQGEMAWRDRLFLTAAVRFDKNSAFGENARAAVYPKLSASWVVAEEPFWRESRIGSLLPELRLRGAWGASGQQPDVFAAQQLYRAVPGPGGESTLTPLASGNPDLKPERGEEIELGFDGQLWNGRLGLEFTWYRKATEDAIVARPMRPSTGFPNTRFENVGLVTAGGTETSVNLGLLTGEALQWDVQTAFSTNWTRIDDIGGAGRIEVGRNQFHVEGFPVASFFDIRVLSAEFANGQSGTVINAMCDGGTGVSGAEMGGPPVPCADAPLVYYGQSEPSWTLALTNTFRRGPWTLRASLDAKGGHRFNPDYLSGQNQWSSEQVVRQDNVIWMALRQYGARGAQVFADGDFVTLRDVSLRYSFPRGLIGLVGASSASITASASNVRTLWMKEGRDTEFGGRLWGPEIQSPANNYPGVAMGGQPAGTRATVRLDLSF